MESRAGYEQQSDAELIRGVADCDRGAFAALYRRHLPAVLGFLASETGDPELTADLAAEVFAAVGLEAVELHDSDLERVEAIVDDQRSRLAGLVGCVAGRRAPRGRAARDR